MRLFVKKLMSVRCNRTIFPRLYTTSNTGHFNNSIPQRTITSAVKCSRDHTCCFSFRNYSNVARKLQDINDTMNYRYDSAGKKDIHAYFENSIHYKNTIAVPLKNKVEVSDAVVEEIFNTNWKLANDTDVLTALKKLAYKEFSNDKSYNIDRYNNILETITEKLPKYDNTTVENILQYLVPLQNRLRDSEVYRSCAKQLDQECVKRFISKDINKMLLMCDWFYHLDLLKLKFVETAILKIGAKPMQLTSRNFTQLSFYIAYARRTKVNMYEIEYALEQQLNDLTLSEIGIITLSFFLTQTKFRNVNFTNLILQRLMTGTDAMEQVHLASIMKTLRYNSSYRDSSILRVYLSYLMPRISELSLTTLVHIAHLAAKMCLFVDELMNHCATTLIQQLHTARIKDIERMVHAINAVCPNTYDYVFESVSKELENSYKTTRYEEIMQYPQSLPRILDTMASKNIYPLKLLSFVMNEKYLKLLCPTGYASSLPREIWKLYWNLRIDIPNFVVPFINETTLQKLNKKHNLFPLFGATKQVNNGTHLLSKLVFLCKEELLLDVHICQILPHYAGTDIVIGVTKSDSETASVSKIIPNITTDIKYVNTDDLKHIRWFVLCHVHAHHTVKGTNEPIGLLKGKFRQLEEVGYTPIIIPAVHFFTWSKLDTCAFIRRQIFG